MKVVCDIETAYPSRPDHIWCVVCKDVDKGDVHVFTESELRDGSFVLFSRSVSLWIGANFLCFDAPKLRAYGADVPDDRIVDLQIASRLVWFNRPGGHSVENFAKKYNLVKPPIDVYDDPNRVDEYVHRCTEDVEITYQMYLELWPYIKDPAWSKAMRVEHECALICEEMQDNGFSFNVPDARRYLRQIGEQLEVLTNEIVSEIGDVVGEEKEHTLRRNKDGRPNHHSLRWLGGVDNGFKEGDKIILRTYRPFNPGSVKDRIEYLNKIGWKPYVKTKTHVEAERDLKKAQRSKNKIEIKKQLERLEKFRVTGWSVNEDNLATLPKDAPEATRKLAEWLTLEARRADLEEWLAAVDPKDSRIHGKFWHIGAWTHRMSHSNPNQGNIFGIPHLAKGELEEDLSGVKRIKWQWDKKLRGLWQATPGTLLVGTDAAGIQLRILAHCMGDEDYANAVANGRKEDGTDVHNVNKRALGLDHITRDDSKTWVYSWLLGAGFPKQASTLRCSVADVQTANTRFLESLPLLAILKREQIPYDAKRGYFIGVDGRKVACNSEHLMLAGYLQNGEACVMKHANVLWRNELNKLGVWYRQIDLVHDEWQVEARNMEEAKLIGRVQCEAIRQTGIDLGIMCPLAGETNIGVNWAESH